MARPRTASTRTSSRARRPMSSASATGTQVLVWEDDPGPPSAANQPVQRPLPVLDRAPLRLAIRGRKPAGRQYQPGTSGFRYWTAAEALRRGADMWGAILPRGTTWERSVGRQLRVGLDQGEDFNAFYDRAGLQFFHGRVDDRASRLSRLAEQLGWGIRQFRPDLVDRDALRNAVNSFFYRDPSTLPPSAPASLLSSEPHSFSRVFTGAFLQALAGMFTLQRTQNQQGLLGAATDAARLLVEGARNAPVVPSYFSQVAAHMVAADVAAFRGRYSDALKSAFVAHGILSLEAAVALASEPGASRRGIVAAAAAAPPPTAPLPRMGLAGGNYGLESDLFVHAPSQTKTFAVASAAPDLRSVEPPSDDHAAASFVEDLFRRGRIDLQTHGVEGSAILNPLGRKTHQIARENQRLVLGRLIFDCGFCEASASYHPSSSWPNESAD